MYHLVISWQLFLTSTATNLIHSNKTGKLCYAYTRTDVETKCCFCLVQSEFFIIQKGKGQSVGDKCDLVRLRAFPYSLTI